jgi:hypothetical protein
LGWDRWRLNGSLQHRLGQETLQLGGLGLQILQPAQLGHLHAAIPALPLAERGVRHAVPAAQLRDLRPGGILLQNPDNLFLGKA